MDGFDPFTSFGTQTAAAYVDHLRGDEFDAVAFLADLASGRPALELAIGTGRIGLPLARTGIRVDGIEQSAAMIEQLHAAAGDLDRGLRPEVVRGDMAHDDAPRRDYGLVLLVYNSIYNLLTQDEQVACFANAARHLADDGVFVIEAGVPEAWLQGRRSYVDVDRVTADAVHLDVNRYDPVTQVLEENHVSLSADGIGFGPIACRLAPPAELDLMARLAGLRLVERHGDWRRTPFTADSLLHVSVYGR